MNEPKQVEIKERSRTYDIKFEYHSDLMCENYDAELLAIQENDRRITFKTKDGDTCFEFIHSDPDRVLALASMMESFARMVKKDNAIDISDKA